MKEDAATPEARIAKAMRQLSGLHILLGEVAEELLSAPPEEYERIVLELSDKMPALQGCVESLLTTLESLGKE